MPTRRPDIVLLVLDTQRADRLSCYGYGPETSPHLDALAAQATCFSRAISAAQWTVPSHASMFTGLYPSGHHTLQSYSVLSEGLPTLAERLSEGGYFTAAFCNNPLVGVINNGLRRGFSSFLNYSGLLTSRPNQAGLSGAGLLDRYRQWFKGLLAAGLNRIQDAFARSDELLAFSFTPWMVPIWQTALSFKGNTAKSLEDAARLLGERRGLGDDQPVFAFINLMGTHMPYHPPRRFVERFAPHMLRDRLAQTYLRRFNSDIYGWLAPLTGSLEEPQKATLDGMYDAEVASQDEQVGAFLDKLRQSGALENTLLLVCSDHGEHLGEKQLIGHTLSVYDELVRVPLLIRDPSGDFPQGKTLDHVVSTRRVFHTVLAAAGLASEAEASLSLVQSGEHDPDHQRVFSEAVPPQNVVNLLLSRQPELVQKWACDQPRRAVWEGNHKLIATGDHIELYDILADPSEALDLRDILPERVEALQEYLQLFAAQANAAAPAAARAEGYDDPQVRRRLRDLGYLED